MIHSETILLPMYRGVVHAHIDKGMHWSVVEHLLLFALTNRPFATADLSEYARLPRSVVVEAVTRLMRAGWVEISTDEHGTQFQASPSGREEALKESLTPIVRRLSRNLHFAIDQLSGTVVGLEGLNLKHAKDAAAQHQKCRTLHARLSDELQPGFLELLDRLSVIPGLIYPDERVVWCDPYRSSIEDGWYLPLTVSGDTVEGVPESSPPSLSDGVRKAVARLPTEGVTVSPEDGATHRIESHPYPVRHIDLRMDDLILGGSAHRDALRSTIRNARRRVIVHSTFLSAVRLEAQLDVLAEAAAREVRIDLLWDRSDDGRHTKSLQDCRAILERTDLQDFVRLWSLPTRSHAKQIVADDGAGGYVALVGSCNWLSSPFRSYEVSIRLRSAPLVADCLSFIEKMLPLDSRAGVLKEELIRLGLQLGQMPSTPGSAKVQLLSQGAHETIIETARDTARRSIFVASNKAGNTIETQVLAPFSSAILQRSLDVSVYYQNERAASALTPEVLDQLKLRYNRIHVDTVDRAHAKLLCWDSDHAVITSLNWLSKDASASNFVGECGVYIESPGLGDVLQRSYLG